MSLRRYNPFRRLRNFSISTKLIGVVAVFLLAIVGLILTMTLALRVMTGVRAYVEGEGLWSKAQKDAVYFLARYTQTQDEADYQRFTGAFAVPLGDRGARNELLKPSPDPDVVRRGFVAGGLDPEDIGSMVFLFRHFETVGFFAKALSLWEVADRDADDLLDTARAIHQAVLVRRLTPAAQAQFLARIDRINADVTPIEKQFSETLGAGARVVQTLLLALLVIVALLLTMLGLLVSWLISNDLGLSIAGLRDGAIRVAGGELTHRIQVRARDELGELAMVFNDMIERRRDAEVALTTATEFRERIMESSTNAIYTMDRDGRFTTANKRTCEITGYPQGELIGLPWANMVPPEYLPDLFQRFGNTIEGRAPILNYEVPLIRKDGQIVTIMFSVAALSRDGEIFGVVGTAEDISERKRGQIELQSRADELARSNQELEQFAYVASHDLQEPLRTVSGFAQLLAKRYTGQLGPEADEYVHYVTTGVQRMKSLIEDLLAYSRVSRDPGAMRQVDLNPVVKTALANLRGAIDAAAATVVCEPMPALAANERQMVQLFQNLVGNAVKFRGESPPVIHISAERRADEWQITVRDNGIGISERHAQQVFVLFQRLHSRDKYPGNGIGLTICKKIVDLHGGRIWVVPNETGAVFRFTLRPEGLGCAKPVAA
ncbi:MAG: hypothetical protein NVS9B10_14530 [Nevskia sp.]